MDKVKAQANQLADKAQEAGKAGQAKLEAIQAKRRADGLLETLGSITYAQRLGNSSAGDEARIEDLVAQLRQYEAEYGPLDRPSPAP
jgi:hypothetical protein